MLFRFVFLLCIAAFVPLGSSGVLAADRTVVVILFDGFAPAMFKDAEAPNFARLRAQGSWSHHLIPAFPTVSMINHTGFATGCWPARHGILSNNFYDPVMGRYEGEQDADWLLDCEPMWVAAERQGIKSAVFNFDRRHSTRRGPLASTTNPPADWATAEADDVIINKAIDGLQRNDADRPRLIALYFTRPDSIAHNNGVNAPKTREAIAYCDGIVGRVLSAIEKLPADRQTALVIGTDHGMADVGQMINIGRLLPAAAIRAREATDGASAYLYFEPGETTEHVLAALAPYRYALDAYPKGQYPAFARLGDGPRAGDMLLIAKQPYWMVGPEVMPTWARWLGVNTIWPPIFQPPFGQGLKATHGYPPDVEAMHGIFYAWGPGVPKGVEIDRLDIIDVHPTVMKLLGIEPGNPVDGKVAGNITAP
jgi:predicted AlkP superfamily pyrophosphatase or phosphodiesterase